MATRRIIASEKTILDKDEPIEERSNTGPAVPKDVIYKLLAFTLAMVVVPIGNASYAGGLAALMANVVLISYIVVAMKEDQSEQLDKAKLETKKDK
ncbi:hypothetical protein FZEAL_4474 [Fusarium zealandicum]|uniref:Vacuolar ATPase assembly integral membrane protein VMA21 n=1 Tax=Fusarium zealandicum TaxID=1053134 RepID=A0A8H4UMB1_9HYPO|nr:hypothetical protein FZEAL_4474 [Fusarium zealandicum]